MSTENKWYADLWIIRLLSKERSLISQSLESWSWKLWTQEELEIGWFLTTCLQEMAKKHLVVEWLSWLPYKSGFINSNILETSKDSPNTPLSLKLLEQRVYELVGGPLNTPPLRQRCGEQKA